MTDKIIMMKKLPAYFLIATGIVLIGFALLSFVNGTGDKENLFQVLILIFGGIVTLFSGISFAIPSIPAPEKIRKETDKKHFKPRF